MCKGYTYNLVFSTFIPTFACPVLMYENDDISLDNLKVVQKLMLSIATDLLKVQGLVEP